MIVNILQLGAVLGVALIVFNGAVAGFVFVVDRVTQLLKRP